MASGDLDITCVDKILIEKGLIKKDSEEISHGRPNGYVYFYQVKESDVTLYLCTSHNKTPSAQVEILINQIKSTIKIGIKDFEVCLQ